MPTVRFMWVESGDDVRGYQADIPQRFLDQGTVEPSPASFPGPPGPFHLLPEELSLTIDREDPAPVFLHESYRANIEKWLQPIRSLSEEAGAAGRARDAVIELVNSRLATNPKTLTVSKTVTSTEQVSGGLAVVGRAVVISPATA